MVHPPVENELLTRPQQVFPGINTEILTWLYDGYGPAGVLCIINMRINPMVDRQYKMYSGVL